MKWHCRPAVNPTLVGGSSDVMMFFLSKKKSQKTYEEFEQYPIRRKNITCSIQLQLIHIIQQLINLYIAYNERQKKFNDHIF